MLWHVNYIWIKWKRRERKAWEREGEGETQSTVRKIILGRKPHHLCSVRSCGVGTDAQWMALLAANTYPLAVCQAFLKLLYIDFSFKPQNNPVRWGLFWSPSYRGDTCNREVKETCLKSPSGAKCQICNSNPDSRLQGLQGLALCLYPALSPEFLFSRQSRQGCMLRVWQGLRAHLGLAGRKGEKTTMNNVRESTAE